MQRWERERFVKIPKCLQFNGESVIMTELLCAPPLTGRWRKRRLFMDKTLLFIVNPRAGKTKSSAPLFDAVDTFGKAGYLV